MHIKKWKADGNEKSKKEEEKHPNVFMNKVDVKEKKLWESTRDVFWITHMFKFKINGRIKNINTIKQVEKLKIAQNIFFLAIRTTSHQVRTFGATSSIFLHFFSCNYTRIENCINLKEILMDKSHLIVTSIGNKLFFSVHMFP